MRRTRPDSKLHTFVLGALRLAIALGAVTGHATDYFLSPRGNDANSGTLQQPWRTLGRLQTAQSTLRPGDTIYFRGGNYVVTQADRYYYSWSASGTPLAPITYKNYNGETVSLVYDWRVAPSVATYFVFLSGNHSTVDGIQFKQTEASRLLAMDGNRKQPLYETFKKSALYVSGKNVIIRNCLIDNFAGVGVQTGSSENLLVEHCRIQGTSSHGFYIASKNSVIRYNTIDGARGHLNSYNLNIQYETSIGNKAYGNVLLNAQAAGVVFSGGVSQNEVFNNVFINAGSNVSVPGGHVLAFWCEKSVLLGPGNKFYNNTAIGKTNLAAINTVVGTNAGTYCRATNGGRPLAEKVMIYNNIFHSSNITPAAMSSVASIRNNIFYNSSSVPAGNDSHNPLLVDPLGNTAAGAMLKFGSPAINAAAAGAPAKDFHERTRIAPDIGAFEYIAGSKPKVPLMPGSFQVR